MTLNNKWEKFFKTWTLINTINIQQIFLEKILKYTNENNILMELGAGSGYTSLALSLSNRNIIASDINKVLLDNIPENKNLKKR